MMSSEGRNELEPDAVPYAESSVSHKRSVRPDDLIEISSGS